MHDMDEETAENIRMLCDSASALVPADGSLDRVRAARFQSPGFARDGWKTVAEMGWLGLRASEDAGGMALGLPEAVALVRVLGRGLVPEPYVEAMLAIDLLEDAGPHTALDSALTGQDLILPAWQATADGLDPAAGVSVRNGRLSGAKCAVIAGADLYAVTTAEGLALIARNASGLTVQTVAMHDGTYREALTFDEVAAEVHPSTDPMACLSRAMVLHAAYLHGAAEQAFEITLEYLRTRQQFDVAIGSFQALQHRATEMKVQLELARASIDAAAASMDVGQLDHVGHMAALRARSRAGELARLVAREAIQMHGAIGYTDEADIGLFARKLVVEAGQFAPEFRLRERFMNYREDAA